MLSHISTDCSAISFAGASLVTGIIAKVRRGSEILVKFPLQILITKMFFDYPIVILMIQMATVLFTIELLRYEKEYSINHVIKLKKKITKPNELFQSLR